MSNITFSGTACIANINLHLHKVVIDFRQLVPAYHDLTAIELSVAPSQPADPSQIMNPRMSQLFRIILYMLEEWLWHPIFK